MSRSADSPAGREFGDPNNWGYGWVVVRRTEGGDVTVSVGNRGEGHDEPSTYRSATLSPSQARKLGDAIVEAALRT